MHVMIDLETLGTKPGCALVSIGACVFDMGGIHDKFYRAVDITKKIGSGLALDAGTVSWWMTQSPEARAVFTDQNRVSPYDAVNDFRSWWVDMELKHLSDAQYIWCHGASFDAPILEAVYSSIGQQAPFKFYNIRDTRTLFALAEVYPDRNKGTHHNALDDAVSQAEAAIKAYEALERAL